MSHLCCLPVALWPHLGALPLTILRLTCTQSWAVGDLRPLQPSVRAGVIPTAACGMAALPAPLTGEEEGTLHACDKSPQTRTLPSHGPVVVSVGEVERRPPDAQRLQRAA